MSINPRMYSTEPMKTMEMCIRDRLYSVRSARSWGVGDVEDLADLAAISGAAGADWILVNPLHAAEPTPPMEASPYLPTTRRFFSPLYILSLIHI